MCVYNYPFNIIQHWWWIGSALNRSQAIYLAGDGIVYWLIYVLFGLNHLINMPISFNQITPERSFLYDHSFHSVLIGFKDTMWGQIQGKLLTMFGSSFPSFCWNHSASLLKNWLKSEWKHIRRIKRFWNISSATVCLGLRVLTTDTYDCIL